MPRIFGKMDAELSNDATSPTVAINLYISNLKIPKKAIGEV